MGKLIVIEQFIRGKLPCALERDIMPQVCEALEPMFQTAALPGERGLYVVSGNAGFQSAVQFWSDARRSGVGLANPELFPWTLANAPCGWLARHFQVTGPNYTFTGKAEALYSAFSQAADDLNKARIVSAWVIAVDFAQKPSEKTLFAALRLALAAPGASDHKPVSWLSGPRSSGTSILFKQKETLAGRYLNV